MCDSSQIPKRSVEYRGVGAEYSECQEFGNKRFCLVDVQSPTWLVFLVRIEHLCLIDNDRLEATARS